jgi:hypothetical protein
VTARYTFKDQNDYYPFIEDLAYKETSNLLLKSNDTCRLDSSPLFHTIQHNNDKKKWLISGLTRGGLNKTLGVFIIWNWIIGIARRTDTHIILSCNVSERDGRRSSDGVE